MMLEWAAEQRTEISTDLINRGFLLTATNQERGVQTRVCSAVDAYSAQGSHELRGERTTLLRRRLQKRSDATTGRRKRSLLRTIISPGRCSLSGIPREN